MRHIITKAGSDISREGLAHLFQCSDDLLVHALLVAELFVNRVEIGAEFVDMPSLVGDFLLEIVDGLTELYMHQRHDVQDGFAASAPSLSPQQER